MADVLEIAERARALVQEARIALEVADADIRDRQRDAEQLRALVRTFDRVAGQQAPSLVFDGVEVMAPVVGGLP